MLVTPTCLPFLLVRSLISINTQSSELGLGLGYQTRKIIWELVVPWKCSCWWWFWQLIILWLVLLYELFPWSWRCTQVRATNFVAIILKQLVFCLAEIDIWIYTFIYISICLCVCLSLYIWICMHIHSRVWLLINDLLICICYNFCFIRVKFLPSYFMFSIYFSFLPQFLLYIGKFKFFLLVENHAFCFYSSSSYF